MKNKLSNLGVLESWISHIPGYLLIKDFNSTYISGNLAMAHEFGLQHPEELQGYTDLTIEHPLAELGSFFIALDLKLKQNQHPISGIFAFSFRGKTTPFLFNKSFIQDKEDSPSLIYSQAIECQDSSLTNIIYSIANHDLICHGSHTPIFYALNAHYDDLILDEQEAQCLFYLIRKKTIIEIASFLKISPKAIHLMIEAIYKQLGCRKISELVEKAILNEFLHVIPLGIIHQLYGKTPILLEGSLFTKLTERQRDCTIMFINGCTMKEISDQLHLSPRTVESHLNNAKYALQCRTRSELRMKIYSQLCHHSQF